MSIRTNTLDLDSHYDLTKSGQNDYVGYTSLFSWGPNGSGELGQNDTISRLITSPNTRNHMEFYW
jgi:hypothetical protein